MKKLLPSIAALGIVAVAAAPVALAAQKPAMAMKPAAASGTTFKVTAVANGLMFDKKSLKAKAGKVTITLTNKSPLPHDLVVEKGEKILAKTALQKTGQTGSLTVTLKKGTYDFVCDVPGHEDAGMKGSLVVS